MNSKKYFFVELKRCFQCVHIYGGILGAALIWIYCTQGVFMTDVQNYFMIAAPSGGIILVFMMCAMGHGLSFCEDMENRYFFYQIIRGSLKRYIMQKSAVVYLSSVFVYVAGLLCFIFIMRINYPWYLPEGGAYRDIVQGSIFGYCLAWGHPILYFLLVGIRCGMLSGILTMLAVYLSTYINSRVFIIAVPALVYQLIRQFFSIVVPEHKCIDLLHVYGFYSRVFESDLLSMLWTAGVSLLFYILLVNGVYLRIKKKC